MAEQILVIDDDPAVRKAFILALEDTSYNVDTVSSGEDGVEKLANNKYQLIFLDLKMPGWSGIETLRKLREVDISVPVYIVTAFHKEFLSDLQLLRQEGIKFELLRKPLGADEIVLIVNGLFGKPAVY